MSESEEVERAWSTFAKPLVFAAGETPKVDQLCFLLGDGQRVPGQSLRQHRLVSPRIRFALETTDESSSPGESHPQALTEPDGNLSAHPALIVPPRGEFRATIKRTDRVHAGPRGLANELPVADGSEIA